MMNRKENLLYPMIIMWGEKLLFELYCDIVYKYTYYCNNMRLIHIMETPITGIEAHQYNVPEYNTISEISTILKLLVL